MMSLKPLVYKLFYYLDKHDTFLNLTFVAFLTGAVVLSIIVGAILLFTWIPDLLGPVLLALLGIIGSVVVGYILLGMLYDLNRQGYLKWKDTKQEEEKI